MLGSDPPFGPCNLPPADLSVFGVAFLTPDSTSNSDCVYKAAKGGSDELDMSIDVSRVNLQEFEQFRHQIYPNGSDEASGPGIQKVTLPRSGLQIFVDNSKQPNGPFSSSATGGCKTSTYAWTIDINSTIPRNLTDGFDRIAESIGCTKLDN